MAYVPSREAERLLGVCANTLRKWADAGEINHIKTPFGQRRYDVASYISHGSVVVGNAREEIER